MAQDGALRMACRSGRVLDVDRFIEGETSSSLPQLREGHVIPDREDLIPAEETIRMGFINQNEIFQEWEIRRRQRSRFGGFRFRTGLEEYRNEIGVLEIRNHDERLTSRLDRKSTRLNSSHDQISYA